MHECPHPVTPTIEWLQRHIADFIVGEDNPASPAWQEELAKRLHRDWGKIQQGQAAECECHKRGAREIIGIIPNLVGLHGPKCALWGSLSDRCECPLSQFGEGQIP